MAVSPLSGETIVMPRRTAAENAQAVLAELAVLRQEAESAHGFAMRAMEASSRALEASNERLEHAGQMKVDMVSVDTNNELILALQGMVRQLADSVAAVNAAVSGMESQLIGMKPDRSSAMAPVAVDTQAIATFVANEVKARIGYLNEAAARPMRGLIVRVAERDANNNVLSFVVNHQE